MKIVTVKVLADDDTNADEMFDRVENCLVSYVEETEFIEDELLEEFASTVDNLISAKDLKELVNATFVSESGLMKERIYYAVSEML